MLITQNKNVIGTLQCQNITPLVWYAHFIFFTVWGNPLDSVQFDRGSMRKSMRYFREYFFGYFILLLQLTTLGSSVITVNRRDEGDWFSGIVTRVQCNEIPRAYEDSGGCHCYHGLTFSTEHMKCQSYARRTR